MAKFEVEIPNSTIERLDKFSVKDMVDEMLSGAAKAVLENVRSNMRKSFKTTRSLEKNLKITNVYKTPSDGGRNIAIGFYGYAPDNTSEKYPAGKPVPLIAMAREYGTSSGEQKKPFLRKSFKKPEIEAVMQRIHDRYIGELNDE